MANHLFPIAAMLTGACTQSLGPDSAAAPIQTPPSPFEFQAAGRDPSWLVLVSQSSIGLVLTTAGGTERPRASRTDFAGVVREHSQEMRRWQAGAGTQVISVEAWPQACRFGSSTFEDSVRIRLSGRELRGCGGRALQRDD